MEPIRYPTVNGETEAIKIEQLRRYLYQLADQINMNFRQIENRIAEKGNEGQEG